MLCCFWRSRSSSLTSCIWTVVAVVIRVGGHVPQCVIRGFAFGIGSWPVFRGYQSSTVVFFFCHLKVSSLSSIHRPKGQNKFSNKNSWILPNFPLPSFFLQLFLFWKRWRHDETVSPKQMLVLNIHFSNYHIELEPKYNGVRVVQLLLYYTCVPPFMCGKGVNKYFSPAVQMLFIKGYNVKFIWWVLKTVTSMPHKSWPLANVFELLEVFGPHVLETILQSL